jgi:hypothetical protein
MHPLVAHCHLGLGKLYHRTDKRGQAQEHLATATTMYCEMGMTYWLEKAEAEMTNLGHRLARDPRLQLLTRPRPPAIVARREPTAERPCSVPRGLSRQHCRTRPCSIV